MLICTNKWRESHNSHHRTDLAFCSLDDTIGDYYYFNVNSGETQWAHPLDEIYRQKVILARSADEKEDVTEVSGDITSDIMDQSKPHKLVTKYSGVPFRRIYVVFSKSLIY